MDARHEAGLAPPPRRKPPAPPWIPGSPPRRRPGMTAEMRQPEPVPNCLKLSRSAKKSAGLIQVHDAAATVSALDRARAGFFASNKDQGNHADTRFERDHFTGDRAAGQFKPARRRKDRPVDRGRAGFLRHRPDADGTGRDVPISGRTAGLFRLVELASLRGTNEA